MSISCATDNDDACAHVPIYCTSQRSYVYTSTKLVIWVKCPRSTPSLHYLWLTQQAPRFWT